MKLININKKAQNKLFRFIKLFNLQYYIIISPYLDFEVHVFFAVLRSEETHYNITF
jgi:hypothetical protein